MVTVFSDISDNVTKDVTKDVTKEERGSVIIRLLIQKPGITADEMAEKLKLTRRTILREIDNLKKHNKIRRIGGRKEGHWQIIKE